MSDQGERTPDDPRVMRLLDANKAIRDALTAAEARIAELEAERDHAVKWAEESTEKSADQAFRIEELEAALRHMRTRITQGMYAAALHEADRALAGLRNDIDRALDPTEAPHG